METTARPQSRVYGQNNDIGGPACVSLYKEEAEKIKIKKIIYTDVKLEVESKKKKRGWNTQVFLWSGSEIS